VVVGDDGYLAHIGFGSENIADDLTQGNLKRMLAVVTAGPSGLSR